MEVLVHVASHFLKPQLLRDVLTNLLRLLLRQLQLLKLMLFLLSFLLLASPQFLPGPSKTWK